jgi:hypothetical protein
MFKRYATMDLVYCCKDRGEAFNTEMKVIRLLYKAGFVLLNKDYNYADQNLYPPIYPHFKRLPDKWCNSTIRTNIIKKQAKIRLEYEQGQIKY